MIQKQIGLFNLIRVNGLTATWMAPMKDFEGLFS